MDIVAVILVVILLIAIPFALRKKKRLERQALAEMITKYGAANLVFIDEKAIFYGLATRGSIQSHELGAVFALTKDTVHIKTWAYGMRVAGVPVDVDVELPLERLTDVYITKKFAPMGPLQRSRSGILVFAYRDENGSAEEIGIHPKKREAAIEHLQRLTPFDVKLRS